VAANKNFLLSNISSSTMPQKYCSERGSMLHINLENSLPRKTLQIRTCMQFGLKRKASNHHNATNDGSYKR
jgi:hypothetical protein